MKPSLFSCFAVFTAIPIIAGQYATATYDASGVYLYHYACSVSQGTSSNGKGFTATPSENNRVRPHQAIYAAFPEVKTAAEAWTAYLNSNCVIGKGTTLTKAWDVSEDYDYDFVTPNSTAGNMYWSNYYDNNLPVTNTWYWSSTFVNGSHSGETVIGNHNILALIDDYYLMFDSDGSLSTYSIANGQLVTNYTWTTFSNGVFQGMALADTLQYMIGAEEGRLFFLQGDNTIIQYNLASASTVTFESSFTFNFGTYTGSNVNNDLAGASLKDLIEGKIEGWSYLGWDLGVLAINVASDFNRPLITEDIPEPTAGMLGFLSSCLFLRRKRSLI